MVTDTVSESCTLAAFTGLRRRMNETERRTGEQGGAYIGGRWVSDNHLRIRGRRARTLSPARLKVETT